MAAVAAPAVEREVIVSPKGSGDPAAATIRLGRSTGGGAACRAVCGAVRVLLPLLSLTIDPPPLYCTSTPSQPWELFQQKMTKAGLSQAAQDAFKQNYEQLVAGVTGLVRLG